MDPNKKKQRMRSRRHRHIRKSLEGTPQRPRLCVFRSNAHIYAQVVDDWKGHTLVAVSSLSPGVREELDSGSGVGAAGRVGQELGRRCLDMGLEKMVFDRGGYKYHGRVKALADGVRQEYESEGKKVF